MSQVKLSQEEVNRQQAGYRLKEMSELPGWKEILKPWLELAISHSWVDPRGKDDEQLLYEYKLAYSRARAAQEILDFVTNAIEDAKAITSKEKGEQKDKLREAVS